LLFSSTFPDDEFFGYAKTLTPAAMDLEIRSLVTIENIHSFMVALTQRLRSRRDFEAVQTYQNVFLRIHGEVLVANTELLETMKTLLSVQKAESERVLDLVTSSLGTLDFVREVL
jgi:U3 small nucleolar RNA-associated protein 21